MILLGWAMLATGALYLLLLASVALLATKKFLDTL